MPFLINDLADGISYGEYAQTLYENCKLFHEKPGFRTKLAIDIENPAFVLIDRKGLSFEIRGIAMQDVVRTRAFWITRRRPDDLLRSLSEAWGGDVELNGEVCCSSGKTIRTMFAKFDCLESPRQRHFVYIADVDMLIASKIAAKNYAGSKPKEMQRQELKKMKEDEDYRQVLVSSLRNEINEQKDKRMFG